MYALLHGFLVGVLLSCMRAPLGTDVVELIAVSGETSARLRAGALFAIAALVLPSRPLFRAFAGRASAVLAWVTGAVLGLAVHALFVLPVLEPGGRLGFGLVLLGALPLFWLLSGRGPAAAPVQDEARADLATTLGCVLVGAGTALALEATGRHVRLFTLGTPEEASLVGLSLAVCVAIGFVAFGRPFVRVDEGGRERGGLALVLGGAALGPATILGLRFLQGLELDPFFRYLKRFDLDFTLVGTAQVTLVVATAAWVAPAFAVGLSTGGFGDARRLRAALFGAAFGVLCTPLAVRTFSTAVDYGASRGEPYAWRLAVLAGGIAAVGSLLVLVGTGRGAGARSKLAVAFPAAAAAFLAVGPRPAVWQASPWWRSTIEPDLLLHDPAGMLTVEREFGTQNTRIVTLDRKRMSPLSEEEPVDRERIAWSWFTLEEAVRESSTARILFVGQMTPARTRVFEALPPHKLERTVPWFHAAEAIDAELFADDDVAPAGELVAPATARARYRDGRYDLVIVPPITGPILFPKSAQIFHWAPVAAPVLSGVAPPEGTQLVAWIDGRSPLASRAFDAPVIPATTEGLQHMTFGLVFGDAEPNAGSLADGAPLMLAPGTPVPRTSVLASVTARPEFRTYDLLRANTERFAAAEAAPPLNHVAAALAAHALPQKASSPYDTRAEQIELSEFALKALIEAARAAEPDGVTRRLWESYAWLLFERREIGLTLTYLESVADTYGPWPLLERVVARAYEEFDEAEQAVVWLDRVLEAAPYDITLLAEAAEWNARAGDLQRAADLLETASDLQPGRLELRRHLGMMWVRAGDPRGIEVLTEILSEHPEDEEIAAYLGVGPLPPIPSGFLPAGGLHGHDSGQDSGHDPGHEGHDH